MKLTQSPIQKLLLALTPTANFLNSHSIEAENLWSLNVMPVQRQLAFYPRTQYDWINNGDHTYKNTTHQNIIMHYLEFIFFSCTPVMPLTLPLTFQCLSKFSSHLYSGEKLTSWCHPVLYTYPSIYFKKKTVGIIINYRPGCNNSHMFLHEHNHQTWTQVVTLPTVPHKVKKSAN